MSRVLRRPAWAAFLPLVPALVFLGVAFTASSVVPGSKAGGSASPVSADDLKPTLCAALSLTRVESGSGTFRATGRPELVLGSAGPDSIRALSGDDCVLGGGGNDFLRGDNGFDVCIGGPGADTFHVSCEVQIQ